MEIAQETSVVESSIMEKETKDVDSSVTGEEYAYLEATGFTSELFKIEVRGLPKYYGISVSIG